MKKIIFILSFFTILLFSCETGKNRDLSGKYSALQKEVGNYLDEYTKEYLRLYKISSNAEWESNIKIVEGDTTNAFNTKIANEALAKFTGSEKNITQSRKYLQKKEKLLPIQVRQLESILYAAADKPAIALDNVKKRIAAETAQSEELYGFEYTIDNKPVSTNQIDSILKNSNSLDERLKTWLAGKEVGKGLKPRLVTLRNLRNKTVQALGYHDYFTYQVSDYDMTVDEMMSECKKMINDIMPLYRELHTYARYELAKKYGKKVPDYLPAHWLPNRWGQDWTALVDVKGIDLDSILEEKGEKWLIKQAERFYISLGFEKLPNTFYSKSSLYPLPPAAGYKKNNHASAWHLDLDRDVRSLMSIKPNAEWYETTHHELGHIYYYLEYSNQDVPPILRSGANRAFHEAIGSLMGLAAMQKPFLENLDLLPANIEIDEPELLLKEALNYIVFIPWAAGVMTEFEHDLYKIELSPDEFNKRWWELKKKYQGIVPPGPRDENYCDPATKTHINDDAAQYYDYALSYVLLFQFHNYIAINILNEDPRSTNYYGNKEIGKFLHSILSKGATEDWRKLLKEATGEDLNSKAMLNYFEPLVEYLKEINKGRKYTL